MNIAVGLLITVGSILGGYAALGGHLEALAQPYEFVIIAGSSLGMFIVANSMPTIRDCGRAFVEAVFDRGPRPRNFLDVLSVAKGAHLIAQRIRAVAKEHAVPVVEDQPLASSLYAAVDVDRPSAAEFYRAVAEIVHLIQQRKGGWARARQ